MFLSFITLFMLFLLIIFILLISFKANNILFNLLYTFQTFPNPPLPITIMKLKKSKSTLCYMT